MVQQPAITGCCHVQHEPALVLSSERLKIQKEQVRLPVDTKEQLTEAGTAAFVSPVPTWEPLVGHQPSWLSAGRLTALSHCIYGKGASAPVDRWGTKAYELSDPSEVPQPGQQGGDLKPGCQGARVPGPGAKHPSPEDVLPGSPPSVPGEITPRAGRTHPQRLDREAGCGASTCWPAL